MPGLTWGRAQTDGINWGQIWFQEGVKIWGKHCQLAFFPENAHWADICLVEPEKGPKNGQKWANVDFDWGFLVTPHDF